MKLLFLFPAAFWLNAIFKPANAAGSRANARVNADTIINHKQDGQTSEWPASLFETDLGTDIKYAVDNDGTNMYVAMDIPNGGIQMKIMKMGMNLYIDMKGKKKEGRGITFPVKDENIEKEPESPDKDQNGDKESSSKKAMDKKVMRSTLALHLVYMKIFGFEGSGKQDQGLNMPGRINIAFAWDTLDVMHIEYLIPLTQLGEIAELNEKNISIGWKLNGLYPSDNANYDRQQNSGFNNSGGRHRIGADNHPIIDRETIVREQNIWKKYIIVIPRNGKA